MRRVLGTLMFVAGISLLASNGFGQFPLFDEPTAKTRFQFEPRGWFLTLSGDARIVEAGIGETAELDDELGIEDRETAYGGRFSFHLGPASAARIGFQSVSFEGDRTLNRTIEFNGTVFDLNAGVHSEMDIDLYEVDFRNGTRLGRDGQFFFTVGAEAFDVDFRVRGEEALTGTTVTEKISEFIPIPTIGVGATFNISDLVLAAEVKGISIGSDGNFIDAEAGLSLDITSNIRLGGGYRFINLDTDFGDFEGDVTLEGAFATLIIRF